MRKVQIPFVVLLALACAAPAMPQQSGGKAVPSELIYHQEAFVFPAGDRRNPFAAPEEQGPHLEDLDLVGVVLGGSQSSVATLIDRATEKRYRVRRGDVVGDASVVEIRPQAVVFRVSEFGVPRTETLTIEKDQG